MTFKELHLKRDLQSAINKAGYKEPSPIQEQAIPVMLAGRDLIACAQTGTGKTAAFALPILNTLEPMKPQKIRALILTPTRELAIQIFDNFKKYGRYMKLRAVCVYGGAKQGPQLAALGRGCDILIATPGRLIDYMERSLVSLEDVEVFVLDEADRMLDMGFIGDVRRIVPCMKKDRQTVMFSATMPPQIEELAKEILVNPASVKVSPTSSPAETVDQKICFTEKDDKKHLLGDLLKQEQVRKSIVFTRTKRGADRLVKDLAKEEIKSISIHGDKTQGQRQAALEYFKAGKVKVLVATDVAARGIDIPKISHVFNYDLPEESESYIHRIGRAGRAGATGEAITLCCKEELNLLQGIEKLTKQEIPEMETEYSVEVDRTPVRKTSGSGNRRGTRSGNSRMGGRRTGASRGQSAAKRQMDSSRAQGKSFAGERTQEKPAENRRNQRRNGRAGQAASRQRSFGGLKIYTIPEKKRKTLEGRS
ncbi:MAG: DEAD/DEAH box helicase [Eubacteriales bacterium]|nr:DEAD/DEAH box helicase [Eubacteriales bacterium]